MSDETRTAKGEPRSVAFRRAREAQWRDLESIVDKVLSSGLGSLDAHALHRLPILYRSALASLSVARRTALDAKLVAYLESLAGRAYLAVYGSRRSTRGALVRAVMGGFPRAVRALKGELILSLFFTILGMVVAIALMKVDPGWYDAFVDPGLANGRDPNASSEDLRAVLYEQQSEGLGFFASFLFTHNAGIGILCFALGFAAGIPTAFLLFTNGLMLGAFIELYASRGMLVDLLAWITPHGIPEIGAVILCGAAGMHLGRAMVLPGRFDVRRALSRAGRRASMVVMGSVLLFAIAGFVEGVLRQVIVDINIRFVLIAINATWFFAWLVLGGRGEAGQRDAEHEEEQLG